MAEKTNWLKRLLYSDHLEERQGTFLNVNLLRHLRDHLFEKLTEKEKGCINLYHLENHLIERSLDPSTEELYKDHNELIKDTLSFLRSRPDYWIINSEIYLEIIANNELYTTYSDEKYVNKDLLAVYNYIFKNNFNISVINKSNMTTCSENCEDELKILLNDYLGVSNDSDPNEILKLMNDKEYCKFVNFIERDSYLEIDYSMKTVFDSTMIPLIYKFLINRFSEKIKLFEKASGRFENFNISYETQMRIQNFILFFSYVSYDNTIDFIWNPKIENPRMNLINRQYKKYKLRINKIDEDELEQLYLQSQIKILSLHEKIASLRKIPKIEEFLLFLKENKLPNILIKGENQSEKSETLLNMIICAYTMLNNIFELFEGYLELKSSENNSVILIDEEEFKIENNSNFSHLSSSISSIGQKRFENFRNLFRIFKELKILPIYILSKDKSKIKDFIFFYCVIVEKIRNYDGCIKLLNEYKNFLGMTLNRKYPKINDGTIFDELFGSNLKEAELNSLTKNYIEEYYDKQETKSKRVYKTENAGINWTQEDLEKFNEGMKRFGHMQLANIKIAKFMGSHIEPSHVKLFRSRISREKRMKRKFEKIEKITEMKKKKNLKWKVYEGELESITKKEIS